MTVGRGTNSQSFLRKIKYRTEVTTMRSKSLISIIRRYGINSRRLSPRYKIKYEDAVKGIKKYESAELKIADVIDNYVTPKKSVSCKCQIPGCGHRIRYEYILENKDNGERMVAGSTCVWPTLGFSEIQKKEFNSYEKIIKEHNDMILWSRQNPDIIDKLETLKREGFNKFRPFWEEVEFSRLHPDDEEYIRNIDVQALINEREEKKRIREENLKRLKEEREKNDREYNKIIECLEDLARANTGNRFYNSLLSQHECGKKLSPKQIRCIKVNANKKWYKDHIKGTNLDIMDEVEEIVKPVMRASGVVWSEENKQSCVQRMTEIFNTKSDKEKWAWKLFRIKHELVY